jgi:hypothetical protein
VLAGLDGIIVKTHNVIIYHCLSCGRVLQVEIEADPPQCCGQAMSKAFTDTIHKSDAAEEKTDGRSATAPPVSTTRQKPR